MSKTIRVYPKTVEDFIDWQANDGKVNRATFEIIQHETPNLPWQHQMLCGDGIGILGGLGQKDKPKSDLEKNVDAYIEKYQAELGQRKNLVIVAVIGPLQYASNEATTVSYRKVALLATWDDN